MRLLRAALVLVLLASAWTFGETAEAKKRRPPPIPVSECETVADQPNRTYRFTTDLTCAGTDDNGIIVAANNITVDFAGHTLESTNATGEGALLVTDNLDVATVKNGTLVHFKRGITAYAYFGGPDQTDGRITIANMKVISSAQAGVENTAPTTVTRSAFINNGTTGVAVLGANSLISRSSFLGNGGTGVLINGDGTRVLRSVATGNAINGIQVVGLNPRIDRNTAIGNGWPTVDITGNGIRAEAYYGGALPVGHNRASGNESNDCLPFEIC
jgi:hypothetical protein